MLRYIFMFVLVMIMVKTSAQVPDYTTFQNFESNTKMHITFTNNVTSGDVNAFIQKVNNDPDFYTNTEWNTYSFILRRAPSSSISKSSAIANYINEPYIASVTFMFDGGEDEGAYWGITNEVLVKINNSQSLNDIEALADTMGLDSIAYDEYEDDVYHLFFGKSVDIWGVCNQLFATNNFIYAEPNYIYVNISSGWHHIFSHNDCVETEYNTFDQHMSSRAQWGLFTDQSSDFNTAYMTQYGGHEFSDINVCHAWETYNYLFEPDNAFGTGVVVAVVDNGVDVRHADLANRNVTGADVIGYVTPFPPLTTAPGMSDVFSHHGTWCAGVVAAERNNGINNDFGMVGVAHEAKIMPIRAAYYNGIGSEWYSSSSQLRAGIVFAYQNGADVINCSWEHGHPSLMNSALNAQAIRFAIRDAVTYGRGGNSSTNTQGKGCVIVFSAGNDNLSHIAWPASSPHTIAVGAMTMCNERKRSTSNPAQLDPLYPRTVIDPQGVSCDAENWWGSNYGTGIGFGMPFDPSDPWDAVTTTSDYLAVVAPGVKIIGTQGQFGFNTSFWGTSAAAPHVAGIAALMLSVNPCMEWNEVKNVIELSATKVGNYFYNQTTGIPNGAWNPEMGHGKANAASAVRLSHDIYKQALTESGDKIYYSPHKIFAGRSVTNILSGGNYTIPGQGVDIKFYVNQNESIWLEPGFDASSSVGSDPSIFEAVLQNTPCSVRHSNYHHYRPGKTKTSPENASGKQPILSSSDNLLHGIKVYPNPAKETINIEFMLEGDADVSFTMLNMLGQKMKETETTGLAKGMQKQQMSLQGLTPGVYFVGIKTPAGYSQFRFIKE